MTFQLVLLFKIPNEARIPEPPGTPLDEQAVPFVRQLDELAATHGRVGRSP